jgi:uracil-DNA glycosylase
MKTWDDLEYWRSKEWETVQERLEDLYQKGFDINPKREHIFTSLDLTSFDRTRVAIIGQDPYPNRMLSTGLAFSIPRGCSKRPPTLDNIFKEYVDDLGYPYPTSGDLTPWTKEGVLLWNAIPTCLDGCSKSHDWWEWTTLTQEIVRVLSARSDVVLVFLGQVARRYSPQTKMSLEYSHPSPRGAYAGWSPFMGSRMFSTINDLLAPKGHIDWKL